MSTSMQLNSLNSSSALLNHKSVSSEQEINTAVAVRMLGQKDTENSTYEKPVSSTLSVEKVEEKMKELSNVLAAKNIDMQYEVDKTSGLQVIKFIDKTNKEVVQQIPSEQMLRIIHGIDEFLDKYQRKAPLGVMVNERA